MRFNIDARGEIRRDGTLLPITGFQFVEDIAGGANGRVFKAKDVVLGRTVAIKLWYKTVYDKNSRALGEVQKLANINHENFAKIFRYEVFDGTPCAIMEYIQGISLTEWLRSDHAALDRALIWSQFSASMRHIYGSNILHGDPHTGNIIVTKSLPGYTAPRLRFGYVPIETKYKVFILDTGTSILWRDHSKFEEREQKVLVETLDRLFGDILLTSDVCINRSLSAQEILDIGDLLCIRLATTTVGSPRGSENVEDAEAELDYVDGKIDPGISRCLKDPWKTGFKTQSADYEREGSFLW